MAIPKPTLLEEQSGRKWEECSDPGLFPVPTQEAYSVARQFNLIPPVCEQADHHLFQREKAEMQLPELYHKIGSQPSVPPFPLARPSPRSLSPHPLLLPLGVGSVTWSPLACGLITSKYDGRAPDTCRATIKVRSGGSGWQD